MKTVYKTDEIPHLWAHSHEPGNPTSARNPQRNLFFADSRIYSYGSHFCAAMKVSGVNGDDGVLINSNRYSSTTSGHLHAIRQAIPRHWPVFEVSRPDSESPLYHRGELLETLRRAKANLLTAKSRPSKAKQFNEYLAAEQVAYNFCEFFGLEDPQPELILAPGQRLDLAEIKEEYETKLAERRQVREADRKARYAKRNAEYAERQRKHGSAKANGYRDEMQVWRDTGKWPDYMLSGYGVPVVLRQDGDEIVTSHGARFPVAHAKLAFASIKGFREAGSEYERTPDGRQLRLGHYAIDSIDKEGNVRAGCHHVSWSEIELLGNQLSS
jgi:hypothetical protein